MNVVVLLNEQHVFNYLGCAGFPLLQTPNADALAADGVLFEQAVCASTPCLPSRHNLLHGLHAFQTGIYSNHHAVSPHRVPTLTMGKVFKAHGYTTAACGKMHFFPYDIVMERGNYFGFDYRAGLADEAGESFDALYPLEHPDLMHVNAQERERYGIMYGGDGDARGYIGYESAIPYDQWRDWWSAQRAAAFIASNKDSPFLVICSLWGPHPQNAVREGFHGLYDPEEVQLPPEPSTRLLDEGLYLDAEKYGVYGKFRGISREDLKVIIARYMACITTTDACHGLVIEALKRNGLYDDTLIVFLADHGDLMGSRGLAAFSKYNLYENAIGVPLIVKPPRDLGGRLSGARCQAQVSLVDILPTILDLAGIAGAEYLPGTSLRPALIGRPLQRDNPVAMTEFCPSWGGGSVYLSARMEGWKLILGPFGEELYHLAEDPNEFHNLAPDPRQAARIAEMKGWLLSYYRTAHARSGSRKREYQAKVRGIESACGRVGASRSRVQRGDNG